MSYTVLARKYRPQTFDDLVGQEHVARTLGNAIGSDRVAHAFLFTGVRGVGKTTTARLLAKALNCEKGPTPTPCNVCDPCKEITAGLDLDVLEMDGASNNSVEDVRRLQESIPYRPARDRFKIIIVDEVHMLSTGAFNAFLKTLEEPPPHVKFIFATTESHKVPITIRSRCQRYDFRLIPQSVVAKRVRQILEAEGVSADDAAVSIVAREAAGSMRDALTLLDQLVAFGGANLRGGEVAQQLGIAGRDTVHEAARAAIEGDGAAVLRAVDALATQGLDMLHFARQLLDHVRDLVVLRVTGGDPDELVAMVDEERERARALVENLDTLELQRAFAALSTLVDDVGRSSAPRTVLEMGLVRIATRPPLKDVAELLARLDDLDKRLGGGGGGGGTRPLPKGHAPRKQPDSQSALQQRPAERPAQESPPPRRPSLEMEPAETAPTDTAPTDTAPTDTAPTEAKEARRTPVEGPRAEVDLDGSGMHAWQSIVHALRDAKPALAAILEHGAPLSVTRERIVIGFPEGSFFGKQAEADEARSEVAEAARKVVGGKPEVVVRSTSAAEAAPAGPSVAELEAKRRRDAQRDREQEAMRHPLVRGALEVFPEGAGSVKVNVEPD